MTMNEFKSASFRVLHESPGHVTFGVWLNGGKSGDLVVRVEERDCFVRMMKRAGFSETVLCS